MCNNQHMRIMNEINYKTMKLINIIKKIISKILNNPYMLIIIEYLSICILPSLIGTVLFSILLMTFSYILIHFRITLIAYPTFTVVLYLFLTLVSIGSLWPKYVSKIIKIWKKLSFNHIKSKNTIKNLKLCNYALYTLLSVIYSFYYLQVGKCSANLEAFYYALVTYLGLDNCINFIKSSRIIKH